MSQMLNTKISLEPEIVVAQYGMSTLTKREREILLQVCTGKTAKEIAIALDCSYRTVEVHRMHLMRKLGVRKIAEIFPLLDKLSTAPEPD